MELELNPGRVPEALADSRAIDVPAERAGALLRVAHVARYEVPAWGTRKANAILAEALESARLVAEPAERAEALSEVALEFAKAWLDSSDLFAESLLAAGDVGDDEGRARTLLAIAAAQVDRGVVERARAPADGPPDPPLVLACRKGDLVQVKALIAGGADLHERATPAGLSALEAAVKVADGALVELLLDAGADPADRDADGWTALHAACSVGDAGIARLLLARGATADAQPAHGETPLALAATWRHLELMRILLDEGADPDGRGADWTPLMRAAVRGEREVCEALIAAGADPARRLDGQTAADLAAEAGYDDLATLLRSAEGQSES
jgi:hypothetical protein